MKLNNKSSVKVLAIDPGYERVGIAVLERLPDKKEILLYSDCFKTSPKLSPEERLFLIGEEITKIIKKFKPISCALEKLFFNTNQKTVMMVSQVRGMIIYQAMLNKMSVFEYNPSEVKIAMTGYGRSTKYQITDMVKRLICIDKKILYDDEFDAIAVGLTCLASEKF
ncbi:MAG: crossover junction endodeoxyribonuclease RuvC [Patescibacteria group bacterium]